MGFNYVVETVSERSLGLRFQNIQCCGINNIHDITTSQNVFNKHYFPLVLAIFYIHLFHIY